MKFAVIGAGGVGGYFGARLMESGHEVSFMARGLQLEALRSKGLSLKSIQGDYQSPKLSAFENPAEIGEVDAVLVAVKAWQVPEVAPELLPLAKGNTFFVPLQNGVEAAGQLISVLGEKRVLCGLCGLIACVEEPGVVRHSGADPFITFGEADGSSSSRASGLLTAFEICHGVTAKQSSRIGEAILEKFLLISAFSGVGGVTRMPMGVLRSVPDTRKLLDDTLREAVAVACARGLALGEATVERTWKFYNTLPPESTASMQRDLMNGQPSELESQTGAVVRIGSEKGVPTPINRFIYQTLLPSELRARGQVMVPEN